MRRLLSELLIPFLLVAIFVGGVFYYMSTPRDSSVDAKSPRATETHPLKNGIANSAETIAGLPREPQEHLLSDDQLTELYGAMSISELETVHHRLVTQLQDLAEAAFQEEFDAGHYVSIGLGQELVRGTEDRNRLVSYRFVPVSAPDSREIRRVELTEEQHPKLCDLHRRAVWIRDEVRKKERLAR